LRLTEPPRERAARLLEDIAKPSGALITPEDVWMPCGYEAPEEARLGRAASLLSLDIRERVMAWWLAVRRRANTPNWDIASTCKIGRARGLLLVEAKAHDKELASDGKSKPRSENGWKNHERIGRAIERADQALERITPGWGLSRDSHYQLSDRFAWAWKLACLGVPVVLVYLGFLKAGEMVDQGQPFEDDKAWEKCLRHHSKDVVPHGAWGQRLDIDGVPLWPLIRTCWLPIG